MRRRQLGQAMTEFIVVFPVLLLLILGSLQFGLLYRTKGTLNLATFQAARAGALNGGKLEQMQHGLARGMAPLFAQEPSHTGALAGYARARREVEAGWAKIDVISPSVAALKHWGGHRIPNANLRYATDKMDDGLTQQDANLLKIVVTYCYGLKVPIINRTIISLAKGGAFKTSSGIEEYPEDTDEFHKKCYAADRLPLASQAVIRMQTDYCPSC